MPASKTKKPSATKGKKTTNAVKAPGITVESVTVEPAKTPKSAKSTKSAKGKVATATATATTTATAVNTAETDNVVIAEGADAWEPSLGDEFAVALTTLTGLRTSITQLQTKLRSLQKRAEKEIRVAQKSSKKKRTTGPPRAPSGFVKPTPITSELADFLGKDHGTEMPRTQVTREINSYIREHNLQDPSNGRRIIPDQALRTLLRVPQKDELTYFNLQRYMSHHFVKVVKPQVASA